MLNKFFEIILFLLILICLSLIIYPTLMEEIKKEEILLLEKEIKSNYQEKVFVYCKVVDIFEIKNFQINLKCEVQDWSKNQIESKFFLCNYKKECEKI